MTTWPRSVLNGVNCKLHDAITELSKRVESVEAATEQAKDELHLYKSLLKRIEREKESREEERLIEQRRWEELEHKLKTHKEENQSLNKAIQTAQLQLFTKSQKVQTLKTLLNERLKFAIKLESETEQLENLVKIMITEKDNEHENKEKMQRENVIVEKVTNELWEKLKRASKELLVAKDEYKREVELYARVELEQAQVERSRQITQTNYEDVIKQINSLQEQISIYDHHIEANGKLIEVVKKNYHSCILRKECLLKKLNEFREGVTARAKLQQQRQINYNKHISALRLELSVLQERTSKLVVLEKLKQSVNLKRRSLQRTLESLSEQIRNSKTNTLLHVEEYHKQLSAIRQQMYSRNVSRYLSIREVESMKQVYVCEMHRRESEIKQKERQLQRLCEEKNKVIAAQESVGEKIRAVKLHLESAQHRQSLLNTEQLAVLETNEQLEETLRITESKVNAKRVERELGYTLMQKELKQQVYELREQSEQLTQMNATIKGYILQSESMLSQTITKIRDCKEGKEKLLEWTITTKAEIEKLEKEKVELDKEQQRQEGNVSTRETQLDTFRLLARNLSAKEAHFAGIQEECKGNYQHLLVELSSQMHTLLTALHLEEQVLHDYKSEFTRNERKCELLKLRYQETVDTLTLKEEAYEHQRNFNSAAETQYDGNNTTFLNTSWKEANESNTKSLTDRFVEDNLVERIHARHILTRSCEREELMQRGNFLDDRIVAMERETTTLKQMLHALGNKSESAPLPLNSVSVSKTKGVIHQKQHSDEENILINKQIELQRQLATTFDAELSDVRKRLISLRRKNAELVKELEVKKVQLQRKTVAKKTRVLNVCNKTNMNASVKRNSKLSQTHNETNEVLLSELFKELHELQYED